MDGYYDPSPLVVLERPIALAGWIADDTRTVGFRLASLTGLRIADTDRAVEHHAGRSVWRLVAEDGEGAYRAWEERVLPGLLADRPHGLITLGDGVLTSRASRERVREQATLVLLEIDAAGCYWRLRGRPRANPAWHPTRPEPLERIAQMEAFWEERWPGFEDADHRVRLAGRDMAEVVDEIYGLIPGLGPAGLP